MDGAERLYRQGRRQGLITRCLLGLAMLFYFAYAVDFTNLPNVPENLVILAITVPFAIGLAAVTR